MREQYSKILTEISKSIDLTEKQYALIEARYNAVSSHLDKEDSLLKKYRPDIIPQGSFLLGTMVKPIMDDDELDVDLVCRLRKKEEFWAQKHLKTAVGDQIKSDETYKRMLKSLDGGRRCWTLQYADDSKFHLDILPSIVDEQHDALLERRFSTLTPSELDNLAIRITDNTLPNYSNDPNRINWLKSNPFGYNAWFRTRMQVNSNGNVIMESVKPIPGYVKDKSHLQRIVQILKRHRDIMFGGYEHKPISIIITTLAARAYNGDTDLSTALVNTLKGFRSHIRFEYSPQHRKEIAVIVNPVNPTENFADKWPDFPQKAESFEAWLDKAISDFSELQQKGLTDIYRSLKAILGSRSVNDAIRNAGFEHLINEKYTPSNFNAQLLNVSHRARPTWLLQLTSQVEISAHYKEGKKRVSILPNTVVPKGCNIFFTASTNVVRPFDVYWQVVNTGEEAMRQNGLRGGIFKAQTLGIGGLNQKEYSAFSGVHWVECLIVKNDVCVARSSEFFVEIN